MSERARDAFPAAIDRTIRRRDLLKGGEKVVVAVSGGPDSVALLYALNALRETWRCDLHVAHYDHMLRPSSGLDAAFVAGLARDLCLPSTIGSDPPGPRRGASPEEAARERRLRFLEDVADTVRADRIATGHTLDDQAETVLMRLLLGAGARGLGGIPPRRERFIRPLIDRRRAETIAYCRAVGVEPRDDPTNTDPAFLRNALRRDVLPLLADRVNARVAEALARSADAFRDDDALLDAIARDALGVEHDPGGVRMDVERLLGLHPALRRRVVRLAFARPPALVHVDAILDLAERGRSGDTIDLPQGLNARLEYGSLLIGRAPSPAPPLQPVSLDVPGRTDLPSWGAAVTVWADRQPPVRWPDGRGTAVLDADAVGEGLVVRPPRRGDRFTPLGMSGSRSLADVLAEAKIPRGDRDRVPVVATGADVLWVVGHRISEHVKVTERTERHLWMTFEGGPPWRS